MRAVRDCPLPDMWDLGNRQSKPQAIIQQSLPVLLPLPLAEFPYLDELSDADVILDVLLDFGKVYPRPTKAGFDLTKFEVSLKLFCT